MRLQNENKAAELQKKFPAIQAALARLDAESANCSNNRIYISVERVDQAVLSNVPLLCSGKGASLCDRDMPGMLGWQHDIFFAVDAKHNIVAHIGAVRPDETLRDQRPVKHLVLMHRNDLSYLVRLTVTGWCHRLTDWKGKDSPLGELSHRDVAVTVYREPDEGFDSLLKQTWTDENLRLHFFSMFGGGSWTENPDVRYFLDRFFPLLNEFKEKTFFNGFYDSLPCLLSGDVEGQLGDVSYKCEIWKGHSDTKKNVRARFTRGDVSLHVFCGEFDYEKKILSFEGLDGTLEDVRQLIEAINVGWARKQIGEEKLQELQQMWEEAATLVSREYLIRLADPSFDLRSAVPGLRIHVQDGDCYAVEVPVESQEAFQRLDEQGMVPSPTDEQVIRLLELYLQAIEKKLDLSFEWGGFPPGIERSLKVQECERLRTKIAALREKSDGPN